VRRPGGAQPSSTSNGAAARSRPETRCAQPLPRCAPRCPWRRTGFRRLRYRQQVRGKQSSASSTRRSAVPDSRLGVPQSHIRATPRTLQ
jgi:hypothetical protein